MMVWGAVFYPEASAILRHYCFGDGEALWLSNSYIRKSPVVVKACATLKEGDRVVVRFRQEKDWRLSYALNGFSLERKNGKVLLSQYIEFDKKGTVFTELNLGLFKVRVDDAVVHAFECKGFWVYCDLGR